MFSITKQRMLLLVLTAIMAVMVLLSFTTPSFAADCAGSWAEGGELCLEPELTEEIQCVPENTVVNTGVTLSTYNGILMPIRVQVNAENDDVSGLPFDWCGNEFDCDTFQGVGIPTDHSVFIPFAFTTPSVPSWRHNQEITLYYNATAVAYHHDNWDDQYQVDIYGVSRKVLVAHVNQLMTIDPQPATQTIYVPTPSDVTDASISFTASDEEQDTFDYTIEMDTDPAFGSIDVTYVGNNQANIEIFEQFYSLGVGTYYWRVRAVETDVPNYCRRYADQSQSSAIAGLRKSRVRTSGEGDPNYYTIVSPTRVIIVLSQVGGEDPTPTPTPSPTPTPTQTPTPTTTPTPTPTNPPETANADPSPTPTTTTPPSRLSNTGDPYTMMIDVMILLVIMGIVGLVFGRESSTT